MPKAKKSEDLDEAVEVLENYEEKTEKEKLLDLHQTLLDLGVHSISDLEVKISRL